MIGACVGRGSKPHDAEVMINSAVDTLTPGHGVDFSIQGHAVKPRIDGRVTMVWTGRTGGRDNGGDTHVAGDGGHERMRQQIRRQG